MGLRQKTLLMLFLPMLLTGCKSVITNLTPRQYARSTNDLYHFEFQWDTRQQSVVPESLKPAVLIGTEFYQMEPVAIVSNRWEAMVPIPADQKLVHYRYKVDYQFYSIPIRRDSSRLSAPYRLEIIGK